MLDRTRGLADAMTIARGETRITVSMVTVELVPTPERCEIRVTDQLAILDGGETAKDRQRGWGECMDKLYAVVPADDHPA
jgi:hypothetical protein